jgi:hypothetical protein
VYTFDGAVIEIPGDGKYWNHAKTGGRANTGAHPDPALHDGVSSYAIRDIVGGTCHLLP